jgi:hypothetical protein
MFSKHQFGGMRHFTLGRCGLALFALLWLASGMSAFAGPATPESAPGVETFLKRDEALALAFPDCKIERTTAFLDKQQVKHVARLAKIQFKSSVVYPYRATKNGKVVGTAYFDTHRVRSLRETVMVVVKADGSLGRVEVLAFAEPKEYLPRKKWYAQFQARKLNDDLNLNRKIRGITGATLTSSATTKCCRRVLALDQVLRNIEAKKRVDAAKKRVLHPSYGG